MTDANKTYVVRNTGNGKGKYLYLGSNDAELCSHPFKNARKFSEFAFANGKLIPNDAVTMGREVVEVTYGLRWFSGGLPTDVYAADDIVLRKFASRTTAKRFPTAQAVRTALGDSPLRHGALGPQDKTGWKGSSAS